MPKDFKMAVLPVLVLIILAFLAVSLYFSHIIESQNEHIVIQRLCMYIYTGSTLLLIFEHFHILMFIFTTLILLLICKHFWNTCNHRFRVVTKMCFHT